MEQNDIDCSAGVAGAPRPDPSQQSLVCSECGTSESFNRQLDLDRHFQSFHLPCWLFCPYPGCRWRGDRVDEFQRHLNTKNCGPRPTQEQQYQIYNVKMVMNWIKDSQGNILLTARNFAVDLVKERALQLGRQEWLDDPWGRSGRRNFVSNI